MKAKKPIFKRWWFWAVIICMIIGFIMPDKEPAEAAPTIGTVPTTEAVTAPLPETSEEDAPSLFDEYVNSPLTDFMAAVEESGYTVTYLADGVDFTSFIDLLAEDYLVGGITEDLDEKTVIVDLLLKSNADYVYAEKELKEKLDPAAAWVAVEEYCQAEYGDFELHYLTGKIGEYAEDESTWFLKAECTVAGVDKICEAKVTGTTDAPKVIFLDVY